MPSLPNTDMRRRARSTCSVSTTCAGIGTTGGEEGSSQARAHGGLSRVGKSIGHHHHGVLSAFPSPSSKAARSWSDGPLALAQINLGVSGNDMYIDRPTRCGPCYPPPSGRRLSRAAASKQTSACRMFCKLRAYLLTARMLAPLSKRRVTMARSASSLSHAIISCASQSSVSGPLGPSSVITPTSPAPPS